MDIKIDILLLDDMAEETALPTLRISFALLGATQPKRWTWKVSVLPDTNLEVQVTPVESRSEAYDRLFSPGTQENFDVVLLDVDWTVNNGTDRDGLDWVEQLDQAGIHWPFLALYTTGNTLNQTDLMKMISCGAKSIIRKHEPYFLLNILCTLAEVKRKRQLETTLLTGLAEVDPRLHSDSALMNNCLADAAAYASRSSLPIMLLGGTGSGKELIARAIHKCSRRHAMPFEVVNCAAIPHDLAEMELFGAEKGSYTGATNSRRGAFERADGGTLFLDEVDRLSPEIQYKLLRAVDYGDFRPIGADQPRRVDIRIISATSRDIQAQRNDGFFLKDLFGRLAGGVVHVPSLSDRKEDIPPLAKSLLDLLLKTDGHPAGSVTFSKEALQALREHKWEFNIRGLRMAIERSMARLSPEHTVIGVGDLVLDPLTGNSATFAIEAKPIDIDRLLELRPRTGNQQAIFDALVNRMPEWVSPTELLNALNLADSGPERAGDLLFVKISQLRRRLESHGFTIERETGAPNRGYRVREVLEVPA